MPTGVYKRSPQHITKMKESLRAFFNTPEGKEQQRLRHLGHKHSVETRKKMSETNKKLRNSLFYQIGENNPRWIKDRTKLKKQNRRNDMAYIEWRKQVWLRDNFKCKIANPDCKGRIEAHHILGWSQNSELRYEVNNGITLCHFHHPRKRKDEMRLSPYFKSLMIKVQ